uniref:Cilia- and flagella-associated protein 157 n=1 Tax=Albugo laibachii Nc14 TaxID=890382 RepID=F0WJU7_9STRA|nr:conserved hypothetical protein [Albugo laibachii Nc14]|eukprot:CCA21549.1 conserved hypothetical protein [Albugo laibachii Nc14]
MIVSKKASDFFGSDADCLEKFKMISHHIFKDQRLEEELTAAKDELNHLKKANTDMIKELSETKELMQSQIQDRERVLAFRAKRLEDVMDKYQKSQEMNHSLLEILQVGGKITDESTTPKPVKLATLSVKNVPNIVQVSSAGVIEIHADASGDTCHEGKPLSSLTADRHALLFHSLSVCREQEYRKLYEEISATHDNLTCVLAEKDVQIFALNKFGIEKQGLLATIADLEAQNQHVMEQQIKQVRYLEQKLLTEQKRWERDKIAAVDSVKDTLKRELESQISQTTDSVARENKHYQMEIKYQNVQVEKILQAHDNLQTQYRQLRQDRQLQEQMIQKLSQKLAFFMQVVPRLQRQEMSTSRVKTQHVKTSGRNEDCTSVDQQSHQLQLPMVNDQRANSNTSALGTSHSCAHEEESMQSIMNATNDALESHIQQRLMQNWKADVDAKLNEYAGHRIGQTASSGKWKSKDRQTSGASVEVKASEPSKKFAIRPPSHTAVQSKSHLQERNGRYRQLVTRSMR